MCNPKISVIIPVYNVEEYLRECLDSVVNQTLKDIEIICINDGSTDKSLEILEEYKNKENRITILTQSNSGAGVARNNGLKVANGEYIAFLDGDDFYKNDFCEKMYNKAKENNADIVVCSANSYNFSTKAYKTIPEALKIENLPQNEIFNYIDMPENIFNTFHNWNWNKIFRTDFVKNNNLKFQKLFRTNDLYFTCTALVVANRITTINEQLVNYRIDNCTSSQATNHLYPLDFIKAFFELRKFLVEKNLYEKTHISYLNWLIDGCLYNINSQKKSNTKKQIIKSIRENVSDLGLQNLSKLEKSKLANHKILYKKLYPMSFLNIRENIFSINKDFRNLYIVITILGLKVKIKRGQCGK